MKIKFITLSVLLMAAISAVAQDVQRPVVTPVRYFIGIQPGLKPILFNDYNQYAWDINLIPITVEYAIDRHWSVRIHSIWDLEIRPDNYPAVLANAGVEIAVPFHLSLKNSEEGHRGFFVAPVITPGYNRLNQYYMLGIGGEAGFSFLFGNKWSLGISAQAGAQLQKFAADRFMRIIPYSIPVVTLGIWL